MIAIDKGTLEGEGELDCVLDHVLVELVIEEGVRVLLPGHCLHAQHVFLLLLLAQTHTDNIRHQMSKGNKQIIFGIEGIL